MIKKRAPKSNIRRNRSNLDEEMKEYDQQSSAQDAQDIVNAASTKKMKPKVLPKSSFLSFEMEDTEDMIPKKPIARAPEKLAVMPMTSSHEFKIVEKRDKKSRHGTKHTTSMPLKKIVTPIALFDNIDERQLQLADDGFNESNVQTQTIIPDVLTIKQAKERRKRLREQQEANDGEDHNAAEEYIPLDSKSGVGSSNKNTSLVVATSSNLESRLVREDDSDEEENHKEDVFEDLRENRISFGKPVGDVKKSVRQRVKEDDMMDEGDEEDQEKNIDEDQEWELLQLKSAGILPPPIKPVSPVKQTEDDEDFLAKRVKKNAMIIDDENRKELPSFEKLEKNLNLARQALESNYRHESQVLEKIQTEMQDAAQSLNFLKQELDDLSEKYSFYQDMKIYIEDLVDCMDHKIPDIESLEERMLNEREQYHEQIYQHWVQEQTNAATTGIRYPLQVDNDKEWWLVDYTSPPGIVDSYNESIRAIVQEASTIFDDVEDEYCSLPKIRDRFESWKYCQPESYRDTYCGLCVQKVFAPFVRLELVTDESHLWYLNPILKPTFTEFKWWNALLYYGVPEDKRQSEDTGDEDHIVPELIRKVIAPQIVHTITHVFNAMSVKENHALHQLVDEFLDYVPPQGDEIKSVFESIVNRLRRFCRDLKLPSNASTSQAMHTFVHKQFVCCLHLLEAIVSWYNTFTSRHVFEWHQALRSIVLEDLFKFASSLLNNRSISPEERMQWRQQLLDIQQMPDEWRSQFLNLL